MNKIQTLALALLIVSGTSQAAFQSLTSSFSILDHVSENIKVETAQTEESGNA